MIVIIREPFDRHRYERTFERLQSISLISCSLKSLGLRISSVVAAAKHSVIGSSIISDKVVRFDEGSRVVSKTSKYFGNAPDVAKAHTLSYKFTNTLELVGKDGSKIRDQVPYLLYLTIPVA